MMAVIAVIAGLTVVYALALASADPWDLALGAVLSVAVVVTFRRFLFPGRGPAPSSLVRRAVRFPALAMAEVGEILTGTVAVARAVLSPSPPTTAGFVELPLGDRSESGVAVNALLITLSPGSVVVDVDPVARTWIIHALDVSDPAAFQAGIDRFYERYQRPVWP
jgi:multicomponent K+:H+ antiporter subunit E/multicomponent Na+:H+ antiporter subunit E